VEQLEDRRLLSAAAAAAVASPGAAGPNPAQAQQRLQTFLNSTPLDPTRVQVAAAVIAEVPVPGRSAAPSGTPQPTSDTAQVVVFQASDPSGTAATGVVIVRQPGGPPAAPGALPADQGQGSAGGTTGSAGGATPTGLGSLEAGLSAALDLPTTTAPAAGAPDSSPGPVLTAVQTTSRGGADVTIERLVSTAVAIELSGGEHTAAHPQAAGPVGVALILGTATSPGPADSGAGTAAADVHTAVDVYGPSPLPTSMLGRVATVVKEALSADHRAASGAGQAAGKGGQAGDAPGPGAAEPSGGSAAAEPPAEDTADPAAPADAGAVRVLNGAAPAGSRDAAAGPADGAPASGGADRAGQGNGPAGNAAGSAPDGNPGGTALVAAEGAANTGQAVTPPGPEPGARASDTGDGVPRPALAEAAAAPGEPAPEQGEPCAGGVWLNGWLRPSDLVEDFLPVPAEALQAAMQKFLAEIRDLGAEPSGLLAGLKVPPWAVATAVGAAASGLGYRLVRAEAAARAWPGDHDPLWTCLRDSG
jgi:hypothetical protein